MSRIDIEDLFERYLNGEAAPGEVERVDAWLQHYHSPGPEWQQMDKAGREAWLNGLFDDIQANVSDEKVVPIRRRMVWLRYVAAIAAVLVLAAGAYLAWPRKAEMISLNVPANQKSQVALADGSKIWVNSGSSLQYPKSFTGDIREVYLSGEAYFDIQHDAAHPFIIHTGGVLTTVLGTAFNIREDKAMHTVTVTVTRGKVSVANGNHLLGFITPNQQISFNTVSKKQTKTAVDANKAIAWQDAYMHFNDITFAEAASQLEKRFNVKIAFTNRKVQNCRFTGTAMEKDKLDEILKIICAFNNATYKTNADGTITIDGPGCD